MPDVLFHTLGSDPSPKKDGGYSGSTSKRFKWNLSKKVTNDLRIISDTASQETEQFNNTLNTMSGDDIVRQLSNFNKFNINPIKDSRNGLD